MENLTIGLISALVRMSVDTPGKIAEACGMDRPSLLAALAGKRALSRFKIPQLLSVLGIPEGRLDSAVVHVWNVGVEIAPLCVAMQTLFPDGATLAVVLQQGQGAIDVRRAHDETLYVIYDEHALVLVRRQGLGLEFPSAPAINPETIQGLNWRGGKFGKSAFITLPVEQYRAWQKERVISIHEYQEIVKSPKPVDWAAVVSLAESEGITPPTMVRFIEAILSATRDA